MQRRAGSEVFFKVKFSTVFLQSLLRQKSGLRKQANLHLNLNQNVLILQTCFLNIVAGLSIAKFVSLYN